MEDEVRSPQSSDFGTLLRHYRLAAGLSQEALAERARMSANGIGSLERGARHSPQRQTIALLIGALALDDEQRREFEAAAARSGVPARRAGGSVPAGPWPAAEMSNLTPALTTFVGRERDVTKVTELIGTHRLLTLVGSGGVGKTRLAVQVGERLLKRYPDGVWFVDFAPITDAELVCSVVAQVLRVSQQEGRRLDDAIAYWLKGKRLLLILDNCEHLVESVASIAGSILKAAPDVRILATSRQALGIDGEVAHRLPSLSIPDAVALFVDRAEAADTRFALTDDNAPTVSEICRRLDGIPLAIELAAARVKVLSIPNLAQRLNERFKILTGGNRTALPRQKTLSALIDWSYDLLSAPERLLFTRLGIFASGFSLDAATAVCGGTGLDKLDILDLLGSLTDKSLVLADTSGEHERYRQLESTASYALEKLSASGRREALARRHAEYFREQAEAADERYGACSTLAWLAEVELELDNYRMALAWSLTQGNDAVLGGAIAGALSGLWANVGLAVEGRYWIELGLERVSEAEQPRTAARLRLAAAWLSSGKRSHDESERAMRLYEVVGDARAAARSQSRLAFALMQTGRLDEASETIARALATARDCGDTWSVARCLGQRAGIESDRGNVGASRELYAQALAAYKALGNESGTATMLCNLAELEFADGHPERALRLASDALEIDLHGKNATKIAVDYTNSAAYCIPLGDFSKARESASEGLRSSRQAQDDLWSTNALQHLALLAALGGDARRAALLMGYVDARYGELGMKREPTEQWGYDKLVAALRETLSADETAKLTAEGAGWSEDRAADEALKV